MKKYFLILMIVLLSQSFLFSQPKNEKGFRAGIAFSNVFGDLDNPQFVSGVSVGLFYRKYTKKNFAIQYEINYTQKGYSTDIDDYAKDSSNDYTLNYLEVPILFVFNVPRTPFDYYFGPFGAFFLSGSVSAKFWGTHISIPIPSDEMNTFDAGIIAGGRYAYDKFFVDIRSSVGFLSFPKDGSALRNFVIQVSGGVRF
jgi:hypothetical protein